MPSRPARPLEQSWQAFRCSGGFLFVGFCGDSGVRGKGRLGHRVGEVRFSPTSVAGKLLRASEVH